VRLVVLYRSRSSSWALNGIRAGCCCRPHDAVAAVASRITCLAQAICNTSELLVSLKNFEDNFVERKTVSDSRDWLKTAVAFANSVPIDYPVMFVGVKDDGSVQVGKVNLETIERSVSEEINKAYPPFYHWHRVLRDGTGNPFLAVIIPGSAQRPHFAGQEYLTSIASPLARQVMCRRRTL
jgi:predicted HTH transcriptional regulator